VTVPVGGGVAVGLGVGDAIGVRVLGRLVAVTGSGGGVVTPSLASPSSDTPKSPNGVEMVHPARPLAETAAAVAKSRRLLIVDLSPSSGIFRYIDD